MEVRQVLIKQITWSQSLVTLGSQVFCSSVQSTCVPTAVWSCLTLVSAQNNRFGGPRFSPSCKHSKHPALLSSRENYHVLAIPMGQRGL